MRRRHPGAARSTPKARRYRKWCEENRTRAKLNHHCKEPALRKEIRRLKLAAVRAVASGIDAALGEVARQAGLGYLMEEARSAGLHAARIFLRATRSRR